MALHRDLTVSEVAELIGICAKDVRELVSCGRLPNAYRIGGSASAFRIPYKDIEHYRTTQPHVAPPAGKSISTTSIWAKVGNYDRDLTVKEVAELIRLDPKDVGKLARQG